MSKKEGSQMTTIKVKKDLAAMVSITVTKLRTQGQKDMTADKLIRQLIEEAYPDSVDFVQADDESEEKE